MVHLDRWNSLVNAGMGLPTQARKKKLLHDVFVRVSPQMVYYSWCVYYCSVINVSCSRMRCVHNCWWCVTSQTDRWLIIYQIGITSKIMSIKDRYFSCFVFFASYAFSSKTRWQDRWMSALLSFTPLSRIFYSFQLKITFRNIRWLFHKICSRFAIIK